MIDRLCSLGSGSYVDVLSNIAFIDGMDAWSALAGIRDQNLPEEMLAVFYHELTHHWTMHSAVGRAVSIAKISAMWAMFGGKTAPSGVSPGTYAKFLSAETFLRAWSEGLAQFAEFDVVSGSSKTASYPTLVLWWLYCLGKGSSPLPVENTNQLLRAARNTRKMIDRKANALRQPFTARTGGYLPGYLAVKRVASRLRAAGGPFEDPDFVFSYLKAFVFNDPITVQMILTWDGMEFAAKYFDVLGQRFADLIGRSDEEIRRAGEELEEFFAARSHDVDDKLDALESQMLPGLFVSRAAHENAQILLIGRLMELGVFAALERSARDGPPPQNVLEQVYRAIAYQRHLFCLASSEVPDSDVLEARTTTGEPIVLVRTPERNTQFLSHWNHERYVDMRSIKSLEVDMASRVPVNLPDLRLEVWIDTDRPRAFLCLHSRHGKRVGIYSLLGPCTVEDLPQVMPRDDAMELLFGLERVLMGSRIKADDNAPALPLAEATASLKERILRDVDAVLSWLTFPWTGGEQIGGMLASKGLGGLPSYRSDGLRGLALLTLTDSGSEPAEMLCTNVNLPPSCLQLADNLVKDMNRLGWAAHQDGYWIV
jgi:hypothetical protein